ncbi:hypothetical protein QVD17_34878 [Tagetes erecta]|uniref:Uncharacterized protein n=1 Tax=Tagetes erecta TaxID=13708 RepID=A0AAD8K2J4_TARER|nr:hypothetical protein QVD17_34878 [Tagetes erecta]
MMLRERWCSGQSLTPLLLRADSDFIGLLFPIGSRCLFLRLSTAVSCCFRSPIVERWLSTKISHMSS